MIRRVALAALFALGLASPAPAQQSSLGTGIVSTNAIQTCGPATGTLSAVGDSVTLPCAGASNFLITITGNLAGTITSTDSTTGGSRRFVKTGVGPLEISTETLSGTQGNLEYRTVGGGYGQKITLTAVTSGSATVTILATYQPTTVFINGPVHTETQAALRAGRAFTTSTGSQAVAVGSNLSLILTNPAGSGVRLVIPPYGRVVACDNPSNQLLPKFYSLPNPVTGLPTTATNITRRGGTSGTSLATALSGVSTTKPDTSPTTANPVGNPFFGEYSIAQDRTLEPGASILLYITGVTTGLAGTPTCSILMSWFEESLN